IRRLSLDLIGLLPTVREVQEFVADTRADAYERLVDRLLASPHYGEKWARPWLDLARYADSDGYEKDLVRPYAWRYRNWLIDAQKEYYSLFAFVNHLEEAEIDAPLAGELGPYLKARPAYDKHRAEILQKFEVARYQAEWEMRMLDAIAKPGVNLEWDFAVTSLK